VSDVGHTVEIGIAYGTEKRRWLEAAVEGFAGTPEGQHIQVNLIPMGSIEGAHAILQGDKRIHVWSPASSMYRESFVQDWQVSHTGEPIVKEELLALTPMVFVMWRERYEAFRTPQRELDFAALGDALHAEGGWSSLGGKPEWGLLKFGHTHPNESNSGLTTLVIMAYELHNKTSGLTVADVADKDFQAWLTKIESGVSGLSNSTGNLMKEMVLKGPSAYDAVFVYESVAIDFLENAEGRWGELHVVYPSHNLWCDNPYYILDCDWSTPEQQEAAEAFLDYLLSEPVQRLALKHGFRPGNPDVPVKFPDSPFVKYEQYGIRDVNIVCEPPSPEVINNLQQLWQRVAGGR
jgi:hypothetical protein